MGKAHHLAALILLLGCDTSREERLAALRRDAGALPDEYEAGALAAFRRLPACPVTPGASPETSAGLVGFQVPVSFRRDTGRLSFIHGGARYRGGDTVVEVSFGSWGWSSFTGRHDGSGALPAGCRTKLNGRVYVVSEFVLGERFYASAVPLPDTSRIEGDVVFQVNAPRPVWPFLLQLLAVSKPMGIPSIQP